MKLIHLAIASLMLALLFGCSKGRDEPDLTAMALSIYFSSDLKDKCKNITQPTKDSACFIAFSQALDIYKAVHIENRNTEELFLLVQSIELAQTLLTENDGRNGEIKDYPEKQQ